MVEVSSDKIASSAAVRYAWQSAPSCNLAGSNGILVNSFRTDDWKLSTQNHTVPYWWLTLDKTGE